VIIALLPIGQATTALDLLVGHIFWSMLGSEVQQRNYSGQLLNVRVELFKHLPPPWTLVCDFDYLLLSRIVRNNLGPHVLKLLFDRIDPL